MHFIIIKTLTHTHTRTRTRTRMHTHTHTLQVQTNNNNNHHNNNNNNWKLVCLYKAVIEVFVARGYMLKISVAKQTNKQL